MNRAQSDALSPCVSQPCTRFYFCCFPSLYTLSSSAVSYHCTHFCFYCFTSLYAHVLLLLQVQSRLCIGWLTMSMTLIGILHPPSHLLLGPAQSLASDYRALEWQAFCAEKPSSQPGMMSECIPHPITVMLVCNEKMCLLVMMSYVTGDHE